MLWLLLALLPLKAGASGQTAAGTRPRPPVTVSEVTWGSNIVGTTNYLVGNNDGDMTFADGFNVRTMSVTITNSGSRPVESVRLAFVFSDPEAGVEWFRYEARSRKRLLPGESLVVRKAATPTLGVPRRDWIAAKSAVITEVKYSDGSVWRHR